MGARIRIVAVAAAISFTACSAHDPGVAPREACPGADEYASQLKRVQGRWEVGYADYERGQKPPGRTPIGTLEFSGCRYIFTPRPQAELEERGGLDELARSRRELPFVDAPRGTVELSAVGGRVWRYHGEALVNVTLVPEPPSTPARWLITLAERPQLGEYLFFVRGPEIDFHRWSIHRGEWRRRLGEYLPGSNPDDLPPDVREMMREAYSRSATN